MRLHTEAHAGTLRVRALHLRHGAVGGQHVQALPQTPFTGSDSICVVP